MAEEKINIAKFPKRYGDKQPVQQSVSPPLRDCVVINKTTLLAVLSFRAWPGIQCLFNMLCYWMPDQVRH